MRKFFLLVIILAGSLNAGCANTPTYPKHDELPIPSQRQVIVLREPIVWSELLGDIKNRSVYTIHPGAYTSERDSPEGTYFFGPGRAVWRTDDYSAKAALFMGGIFVPKSATEAPSLFWVADHEVVLMDKGGSIVREDSAQPAINPIFVPTVGVGANVAGNVLGGVLVSALIRAACCKLVKVSAPLGEAEAGRVASALRDAKLANESAVPSGKKENQHK